jgi:hypothetical protein
VPVSGAVKPQTRLYLADVNALHPFREGNGRAQRAFFSQLAHDAGHHIAWVRMDPDRNTAASAAAHHGDPAPLRGMLNQLTELPQVNPSLPCQLLAPVPGFAIWPAPAAAGVPILGASSAPLCRSTASP